MTILFKVFLANFWLYFLVDPNCDLLSNGSYKILYTFNSTELGSQLEINNAHFVQHWDNGDSAKGLLSWVYHCTFKLDYINASTSDSLTEFEKMVFKSFGDSCFELEEKKGDTILFRKTYSGNLHVTTNKGMIIKIK